MKEIDLLDRLVRHINEKKDTEAIAMIRDPKFGAFIGKYMTKNIESSITSGKHDEALELAGAVRSFLKTAQAKLLRANGPNFGTAALPADW
jgi:lactam utilization protein B